MPPRTKLLIAIAVLATLGGLALLTVSRGTPSWLASYPFETHDDLELTLYSVPGPPPAILPAAEAWAKENNLDFGQGSAEDIGDLWVVQGSDEVHFEIYSGRAKVTRSGGARPEIAFIPDPRTTTVVQLHGIGLWAGLLDRLIPSRTSP